MTSAIRLAPALFLGLGIAACGQAQDRSVEDLVEASRRAYDLLEPGLREAAERTLEDCRRQAALVRTQPSVDGQEAGRFRTEYESADGKVRKVLTIRTYVLQAAKTSYEYELRGISSITMKPSREIPFEAKVEVLVTQVRRTKDRTVRLPPVPEGYRPRENAPIEESEVAVIRRAPPTPTSILPLPSEPTELSPELPAELATHALSLKGECLASEPTRTQKTYVLTFTYSATEKRWK